MDILSIIFLVVLAGALAFFVRSVRRLLRTIGQGKAEDRFGSKAERLRRRRTILPAAFPASVYFSEVIFPKQTLVRRASSL